jgi:hypothetical protein
MGMLSLGIKSLSFYCNPLILGTLEYKDHQLLDIGH